MPTRTNRYNRSSTRLVEDLRTTIDCLPVTTREAMLEAVRHERRIIVGAYVDPLGGVCPMLAAHRRGGRTDFLAFAKSWDRFTRAERGPRKASSRELEVLAGQLEASLMSGDGVDLARAIDEHRGLLERHERARAADPTGEIALRRLGARIRALAPGRGAPGGPSRQAATGSLRGART